MASSTNIINASTLFPATIYEVFAHSKKTGKPTDINFYYLDECTAGVALKQMYAIRDRKSLTPVPFNELRILDPDDICYPIKRPVEVLTNAKGSYYLHDPKDEFTPLKSLSQRIQELECLEKMIQGHNYSEDQTSSSSVEEAGFKIMYTLSFNISATSIRWGLRNSNSHFWAYPDEETRDLMKEKLKDISVTKKLNPKTGLYAEAYLHEFLYLFNSPSDGNGIPVKPIDPNSFDMETLEIVITDESTISALPISGTPRYLRLKGELNILPSLDQRPRPELEE